MYPYSENFDFMLYQKNISVPFNYQDRSLIPKYQYSLVPVRQIGIQGLHVLADALRYRTMHISCENTIKNAHSIGCIIRVRIEYASKDTPPLQKYVNGELEILDAEDFMNYLALNKLYSSMHNSLDKHYEYIFELYNPREKTVAILEVPPIDEALADFEEINEEFEKYRRSFEHLIQTKDRIYNVKYYPDYEYDFYYHRLLHTPFFLKMTYNQFEILHFSTTTEDFHSIVAHAYVHTLYNPQVSRMHSFGSTYTAVTRITAFAIECSMWYYHNISCALSDTKYDIGVVMQHSYGGVNKMISFTARELGLIYRIIPDTNTTGYDAGIVCIFTLFTNFLSYDQPIAQLKNKVYGV